MAKGRKKYRASSATRKAARQRVADLAVQGKYSGDIFRIVVDEYPKVGERTLRRYIADSSPCTPERMEQVRQIVDLQKRVAEVLPRDPQTGRMVPARPESTSRWADTAATLVMHATGILTAADPTDYRAHGAAARLLTTAASFENLVLKSMHWDKISPDHDLSREEVQAEVVRILVQNLRHFPADRLDELANAIDTVRVGMETNEVGGVRDDDGIA